MAIEIKIVRKQGWDINPDDNFVNNHFRSLERNNGHCPTKVNKRNGHDQCPCADYLENNICHCGLYINNTINLNNLNENETDINYHC